jgi:rSAM/selenodomain-associated transferase 1
VSRPRPARLADGDGAPTGGRSAIVVNTKEPVAGATTTRLIPAFGPDGAARAAAAMLADTLAVAAAAGAEPWVCFTPPAARARLARLAPGFGLLPQRDGDLGDRLAACFEDLLGLGVARMAIVAADTPQLPASSCQEAFALLDQVDVVLGPCVDGGYYLVAATACWPELFVGVPMGSDAVLQETTARAGRLSLKVGLLPVLRDLDRVEDLKQALAAGELDGCPHTRVAVAELLATAGTVSS